MSTNLLSRHEERTRSTNLTSSEESNNRNTYTCVSSGPERAFSRRNKGITGHTNTLGNIPFSRINDHDHHNNDNEEEIYTTRENENKDEKRRVKEEKTTTTITTTIWADGWAVRFWEKETKTRVENKGGAGSRTDFPLSSYSTPFLGLVLTGLVLFLIVSFPSLFLSKSWGGARIQSEKVLFSIFFP